MFENEWLPYAISIGISYKDFWNMNPRIIKAISKGYKEKMDDIDYLMWMMGSYVKSAVFVAVDHVLNGPKAKSKYIEKPFSKNEDDSENRHDNKESNEQVAVYEMKQRINLLRQKGLPESPI